MIVQDWFNLTVEELIQCQARIGSLEHEFFQQSLRNAALAGTSKIDFLLADILRAFLKKPESRSEPDIVERFSFDVKIRLCYRLGLIDQRLSRALHFLRQTRNTFAHRPTSSEPERRQLVKIHRSLRDEYMYMLLLAAYTNNDHLRTEAERHFVALLMYIIMLLSYYLERIEPLNSGVPMCLLKSTLPTCTVKAGNSIEIIEARNLPSLPKGPQWEMAEE